MHIIILCSLASIIITTRKCNYMPVWSHHGSGYTSHLRRDSFVLEEHAIKQVLIRSTQCKNFEYHHTCPSFYVPTSLKLNSSWQHDREWGRTELVLLHELTSVLWYILHWLVLCRVDLTSMQISMMYEHFSVFLLADSYIVHYKMWGKLIPNHVLFSKWFN